MYTVQKALKEIETIFLEFTETHQGFEVVFHELSSKKSEKVFEDNQSRGFHDSVRP